MPRPKATERVTWLRIEQLKKRNAWPVTRLAEVLGWHRSTIYNYLQEGLLEQTGNRMITTASILKCLENEGEMT
jgi:DNA-binding IclR family transcriptional regulator